MSTKRKLLVDASVLIHFERAGILKTAGNSTLPLQVLDIVAYDEFERSGSPAPYSLGFKQVSLEAENIEEANRLSKPSGLSNHDILQIIYCKKHDTILLTADKKLQQHAENRGVRVIRGLKPFILFVKNGEISPNEAIVALEKLKQAADVRIPNRSIDTLIEEIARDFDS